MRQVWWDPDAPRRASQGIVEEVAWVEGQLAAALDGYDGRALIVAKSLGTLAARAASDRRYPAAWLAEARARPPAWRSDQAERTADRWPGSVAKALG